MTVSAMRCMLKSSRVRRLEVYCCSRHAKFWCPAEAQRAAQADGTAASMPSRRAIICGAQESLLTCDCNSERGRLALGCKRYHFPSAACRHAAGSTPILRRLLSQAICSRVTAPHMLLLLLCFCLQCSFPPLLVLLLAVKLRQITGKRR